MRELTRKLVKNAHEMKQAFGDLVAGLHREAKKKLAPVSCLLTLKRVTDSPG